MVDFAEGKFKELPAITMKEICRRLDIEDSKMAKFYELMTPMIYLVDPAGDVWVFGMLNDAREPASARLEMEDAPCKDHELAGQWRFIANDE